MLTYSGNELCLRLSFLLPGTDTIEPGPLKTSVRGNGREHRGNLPFRVAHLVPSLSAENVVRRQSVVRMPMLQTALLLCEM
jgi:hypothetical protein